MPGSPHDRSGTAILLAAGESTRMGRGPSPLLRTSKALLPWGKGTLVLYQVEKLLEAGLEQVVVVTGYQAEAVQGELASLQEELRRQAEGERLTVVVNEAYATGKVSSVLCGLRAVGSEQELIVVLSVDQPRPAWFVRLLLEAHRSSEAPLTLPRYQGRGGHPTIFAGRLYEELLTIKEETLGLRAVVERHRSEAQAVEVETPLATLDLNEPQDYERARALLGSGPDSW